MPTFALNFSRPGGQVIAQYFNFLRHGREGYEKIQQACADHGKYIAQEIEKIGLFDVLYNGEGGIPGACWMLKKDVNPGFSLYDLTDKLRSRGWQVASYSLPTDCQDMVIQRVLIRHGFSRDMAELLLDDLKRSIEYFQKHPVSVSLSEEEAGSFKH